MFNQIQADKSLGARWWAAQLVAPLERREAPWWANWGEVQGLEQPLAQQPA